MIGFRWVFLKWILCWPFIVWINFGRFYRLDKLRLFICNFVFCLEYLFCEFRWIIDFIIFVWFLIKNCRQITHFINHKYYNILPWIWLIFSSWFHRSMDYFCICNIFRKIIEMHNKYLLNFKICYFTKWYYEYFIQSTRPIVHVTFNQPSIQIKVLRISY